MTITWRLSVWCVGLAMISGCTSQVLLEDGSTGSSSEGGSGSVGATTGAGITGPYGTPCSFLHGTATLTSWQGNQDDNSYALSAYSFELASQDPKITRNDWDVLYAEDGFLVNTVTDDQSVIADLGDVALSSLPKTIDINGYPAGPDDAHDGAQAVQGHTFWVRTLDSDTRQVAAFRVTALAPGESVTIEWVRSLDTDTMVIPQKCL